MTSERMTLNQASWYHVQIEVMDQADMGVEMYLKWEIENALEDSIYDSIVDDVVVPVLSQIEGMIG